MKIRIPGYKLKRKIGSGGMASVYLAVQESLDRKVAMKVMSPALAADQSFTKRFLREAKTVAALDHPNIVAIYDVGVTENQLHYFSMAHLPGGDLGDRIRAGMSESELARVLISLVGALGYAHERGYVHRDVKPGNILFDANGRAFLTDFGIARAATHSTRVTVTGVSVGTSHYMSPEQARGKDVDQRSDLYSVGALAFEALAGRPPFEGEDGFAIAYSHVFDPIPGLPDRYAHWQPFIDQALAKKPENRFLKSDDMIAALKAMIGGDEPIKVDEKRPPAPKTTPLPVVGGKRPFAQKLKVLRGVAEGAPGMRRNAVFSALVAGASRLDRTWQRISDRLFVFLPQRFRSLAGVMLAFVVIAGLAVLLVDRDGPPPVLVATSDDPNADAPSNVVDDVQDEPVDEFVGPPRPQLQPGVVDSTPEPPLRTIDLDNPAADPGLTDPLTEAAELPEGIDQWLALARIDLEANRLTTPVGASAVDRYRQVLAEEPDHPEALAGLEQIVDRYLPLARAEANKGDVSRALLFLQRASDVSAAGEIPAADDRIQLATDDVFNAAFLAIDRALDDGDQARAQELLETVRGKDPDDPRIGVIAQRIESDSEPDQPTQFRDAMASGGNGPAMVVVDLTPFSSADRNLGDGDGRVAFAEFETTVAEFRRFVEATGYYKTNRPGACRDKESRWRSSRDRTWSSPGFPQGDDHPAVCLDWDAANAYATWMASETGFSYRLPSETEWEFVATRDGDLTGEVCARGNVGDLWLKQHEAGRNVISCEDGWTFTAPVAGFPRNSAGIRGVIGNVREWTADCWNEATSVRFAPALTGDCGDRVVKGISWFDGENAENPAHRQNFDKDIASNTLGFRLVRTLQ